MFPRLTTLPKTYQVSDQKRAGLRNLERILSDLVNSVEFEDLIIANNWASDWGHCVVASEAMQILAWETLGVYLVTMNAQDDNISHWFLKEPLSEEIYDPTQFQFAGQDISEIYECAVARGIQTRTRKSPYTRSPCTQMLVEIVLSAIENL